MHVYICISISISENYVVIYIINDHTKILNISYSSGPLYKKAYKLNNLNGLCPSIE